MKPFKIIIYTTILLGLFLIGGCKEDNELSPEQLRLQELAKNWEPADENFVTFNNVDVSSVFNGFKILFDKDKGFISENGNSPVWPATGNFTFKYTGNEPDLDKLIRNDGVEIEIVTIDDDELTIRFTYVAKLIEGRVHGVSGDYEFNLSAE